MDLMTITEIMMNLVGLSFVALFLKGLHSAWLYDKTMKMLDRDHREYLKTNPTPPLKSAQLVERDRQRDIERKRRLRLF